MAVCMWPEPELSQEELQTNLQEQEDELLALQSIFGDTGQLQVLNTPGDHGVEKNEESGNSATFLVKSDKVVDASCEGASAVIDSDQTCFDSQHSFQITIPVQTEQDALTIEVWIPYEHDVTIAQQVAAQAPVPRRPQLERTESGRRWYFNLQVHYLTPLTLQVSLPHGYPSQSPPRFTLSCLWLDADRLTTLCQELDSLWSEQEGMPVVHSWVVWLQNNTLSHLGITDTLQLTPHLTFDPVSLHEQRDPRALPECSNLHQDLVRLLRYDQQKDYEHFIQSTQHCGICYMEKLGSEFFRLGRCLHHFCRECIAEYCELHIKDGTVQQLSCPDQKCEERLPPGVIRGSLGEEAYQRWEKLLLQKTLDTMGDVEWCPRCNMPVIREQEQNLQLAFCTHCTYAFCTNCRDPWHQGSICKSIQEKLRQLEAERKEKEEMDKSTQEEKARRLRELQLELLCQETIKEISTPCPSCRTPIQKIAGCNKVVCTQCGTNLCWHCGQEIQGYQHFSESPACNMFDGMMEMEEYYQPLAAVRRPRQREEPEEAVRIRQVLQQNPGAAVSIINCPSCKQRNLKENRNNHLRCWSCKRNFCYQCRKLIKGQVTTHFMVGMPCQQHSD